MPILAQESLQHFYAEFTYLGPFLVLFLCGLGLPLPEEVTLIASGLLLFKGKVEFVPIVLVCSAAILLGDSVPFWLGRRYGKRALKTPWVARILHPERFSRLEKRFEEHGSWATFGFRFFAGVRIPGYFVAGTMRMSYLRFLLIDAAGIALSVPLSIYLGKLFGDQVDRLKGILTDFHLILAFLVVALLIILVVRGRRRPRPRGGAAEQATSYGSEAPPSNRQDTDAG